MTRRQSPRVAAGTRAPSVANRTDVFIRDRASVLVFSGVLILLVLSGSRGMSSTINCLVKEEGLLNNVGECSILSTGSLMGSGGSQTLLPGSLGETLRATEATDLYTSGKVPLRWIAYGEGPPLKRRNPFGIADLVHELLRIFVLPAAPRHPKQQRRRQE